MEVILDTISFVLFAYFYKESKNKSFLLMSIFCFTALTRNFIDTLLSSNFIFLLTIFEFILIIVAATIFLKDIFSKDFR